jgi:hypothetical protein
MREQLPELLHGQLSPATRVLVERHVAECADCAAELEVLRQVRAVARTPKVDVARIAASIPPYRGASAAWAAVRSQRAFGIPTLYIAAAVLAILTATGVLARLRTPPQATDVPRVTPPVATNIAPPVTSQQAKAPAAAPVTQLSLGEPLADLSEGDLRALMETVDDLEAAPSADVESAEPSLIDIDIEGES